MAGTVVDGEMSNEERDNLLIAMAAILAAIAEREGAAPNVTAVLKSLIREWSNRA